MRVQAVQESIAIEYQAEMDNINKIKAERLGEIELAYRREFKALKDKLDNQIVTQEQYDARVEQLENSKKKKENEVARKAFEDGKKAEVQKAKAEKRIAIEQIAFNTAIAVTNAFASIHNTIAAAIAAAGIITMGGIQAATASSSASRKIGAIQNSPFVPPNTDVFGDGGLIVGKSHSEGGRNVNVEGGEAIINKRSLADSNTYSLSGTPLQIADSINTLKGYGKSIINGSSPTKGIFQTGGRIETLDKSGKNDQDVVVSLLSDIKQNTGRDVRAYVLKNDITETTQEYLYSNELLEENTTL